MLSLDVNVFESFRSLLQGQFDLLPLIIYFRTRREPRFSSRFSTVSSCIYSLKPTILCFFEVHPKPAYCHSLTPYKRISDNLLWLVPFFSLILLLLLLLLSIYIKINKKALTYVSVLYLLSWWYLYHHLVPKARTCCSRILSNLIMATSIKLKIDP